MDLKNATLEELQQRRIELAYTAQGMALEGIDFERTYGDEWRALEDELARRRVDVPTVQR